MRWPKRFQGTASRRASRSMISASDTCGREIVAGDRDIDAALGQAAGEMAVFLRAECAPVAAMDEHGEGRLSASVAP